MPSQPPAQLGQSFFLRPTLEVAESLLGKLLIRRLNDTLLVGKIVETEAYCGAEDLACHASRGKTPRTAIMFGPGGYWYIYLIYGIHHCLNIVTEREDYPAAVLIRAVEPLRGFAPEVKTNGPGKLCKAYQLMRALNGTCAFTDDSQLWIADHGEVIERTRIVRSPRIGVDYAQEYQDKPWRFYILDHPWVSQPSVPSAKRQH